MFPAVCKLCQKPNIVPKHRQVCFKRVRGKDLEDRGCFKKKIKNKTNKQTGHITIGSWNMMKYLCKKLSAHHHVGSPGGSSEVGYSFCYTSALSWLNLNISLLFFLCFFLIFFLLLILKKKPTLPTVRPWPLWGPPGVCGGGYRYYIHIRRLADGGDC